MAQREAKPQQIKTGPQKILSASSDAEFCVCREIEAVVSFRYPPSSIVTVL